MEIDYEMNHELHGLDARLEDMQQRLVLVEQVFAILDELHSDVRALNRALHRRIDTLNQATHDKFVTHGKRVDELVDKISTLMAACHL